MAAKEEGAEMQHSVRHVAMPEPDASAAPVPSVVGPLLTDPKTGSHLATHEQATPLQRDIEPPSHGLNDAAQAYLQRLRESYRNTYASPWPVSSSRSPMRVSVGGNVREALMPDMRASVSLAHFMTIGSDISRTAIIIENISEACMGVLGALHGIDVVFFAKHVNNEPEVGRVNIFVEPARSKRHWIAPSYATDSNVIYHNASGNFEYRDITRITEAELTTTNTDHNSILRETHGPPNFPVFTNTKLSYNLFQRSDMLPSVLVLVDAPPRTPRGRVSLRFPSGPSTGGILVPPLLEDLTKDILEFDLFGVLSNFFGHRWHWRLFGDNVSRSQGSQIYQLAPVQPLLHFLACSSISTSIDFLEDSLNEISAEATMDVSPENLTARLHRIRQNLTQLECDIQDLIDELPDSLNEYCASVLGGENEKKFWPSKRLPQYNKRAANLQTFLMNTFTLLLSNVSIREAQESRRQGARTTLVTILAFIFIPMTLVTGIFGMNVGISDAIEWWWVFVAFAIIMLFTVFILICINGPARSWNAVKGGCAAVWNTWREDLCGKRKKNQIDVTEDCQPLLPIPLSPRAS